MNRDEVDRALAELRDEKERIGAALLELEAHHGYRLLEGAAVTGETAARQAALLAGMSGLWTLFDLYGRTLGAAEELRARHARPGAAQLAELTRLLSGPSVELPAEEVPLERRTLLAATGGERVTLRDVVARMTPMYEEAARTVAAVDTVWSALLARLDEVEADLRAAGELAGGLGAPEPDYERLRENVRSLAAAVRSDPLAVGTGGLDAAARELAGLRERLAEAARFRAGFEERMRKVRDAIGLVRDTEDEIRRARERVLEKIASPALPAPTALAATLDDRLAALYGLRDRRRWGELAERAAELDRAARDALQRARGDLALVTGLLDRREELRGRLRAYKAKAGRLGLAEDAGLGRMYEEAREVLWTSPCDLRKATVMLSGYQQAIAKRAEGR
ncbi:hypothetical protein [Spirillospora sp. NPDC029432]|uniref:hypothetical protein n=1 Tax=Spirillospora sp. NPDC029432 TaxID=3154599 RepID=UPI0034515581